MDRASTGCEFFIIAFRGTDSNRFVPEKVGAIGFRLFETEPEMAIGIKTPSLRLRSIPNAVLFELLGIKA